MTIEELYEKHKDEPQDGGRGFHTWQLEIFNRISDAIADDEEATALLNYTCKFANEKSHCAG